MGCKALLETISGDQHEHGLNEFVNLLVDSSWFMHAVRNPSSAPRKGVNPSLR